MFIRDIGKLKNLVKTASLVIFIAIFLTVSAISTCTADVIHENPRMYKVSAA
jgi:hypothetical protein